MNVRFSVNTSCKIELGEKDLTLCTRWIGKRESHKMLIREL